MAHPPLKKWLLVPLLPAAMWIFLGSIILFGVAPQIYLESGRGVVAEKIGKDPRNHSPSVRFHNGPVMSVISVHSQIQVGDHVEKVRGSFVYRINGRPTHAMAAYMGEFAPMLALVSVLGTLFAVFMVLNEPKTTPRLAGALPTTEPARLPPPPSTPPTAELALPYREGSYHSSGTFSLAIPQALAKLGVSTFTRLEDKLLKIIQAMVTLGGEELHLQLDSQQLLLVLHSPLQAFSPLTFEAQFEYHMLESSRSAEHFLAVGLCSLSHGPVQSIHLSLGQESVTLLGSNPGSGGHPELRLSAQWTCPEWEALIPDLTARCIFAPLPLFLNGQLANGRVGWQRHDHKGSLRHLTPVGTQEVPHWHFLEAFFGGSQPQSSGLCLRPSGGCRATVGPAPPWPTSGDPQRGYPWTTDFRVVVDRDRPLIFRGKYHLERFDSQLGQCILCLDEQGASPGVIIPVQAGVTLEPIVNVGFAGLYAVVSADALHTDLSGLRVVRDPALLELAQQLRAQAQQALQMLIDSPQVLPVRTLHYRPRRALGWLAVCAIFESWALGGFAAVLLVTVPLMAFFGETLTAALEAHRMAPHYRQQQAERLRARILSLQGEGS